MERYYCIKPNILRTDMLSNAAEPGESFKATTASSQQIPKPKGAAGRPSRGGYQLATVLGWELSQLNALQVSHFDGLMSLAITCRQAFPNELITEHMDVGKTYARQKPEVKQLLKDKVKSTLSKDEPSLLF